MNLEEKIVENLVFSEEFCRKVLPHTQTKYFEDHVNQVIVSEVADYFAKYNKPISKDILEIQCLARTDLTQNDARAIPEFIAKLERTETNLDWLITETEKYYQKRSVYNAILDSIQIIDGADKKRSEDAIPSLLSEALAVSFDMQVGHDYLQDSDKRFDFYHSKEEGIPFDLERLNHITDGAGMRKKSLTAVGARTGGGKSVMMCHVAANTLRQGKNVLYITLEMSEERIAQRIDANLLNIPMQSLTSLTRDVFETKLDKLRAKTNGKLVIKEYPMGSAHAGHFRALIEELKIKRAFTPDLIVVDYLGICASARVRNANANSYTIMGSVAEELRALGQEYNVPVFTGVQINRGGIDSSDIDMTDTAESLKIVFSLDLYIAMIRTEELDELGQVLVKVLKNRSGRAGEKFVLGIDLGKSMLYDVEQSAQRNINSGNRTHDEPLFDRSKQKIVNSDKFKF